MTSFSPSLLLFPSPKSSPNQPNQSSPNKPNTLISLLQLCRSHKELSQSHSLFVKTALIEDKHAFGRLLFAFASISHHPNSLSHSRSLFESPHCPRNSFTYNCLIKCYSRAGDPNSALLLFYEMIHDDSASPDGFTFTFVCNACAKSPSLAFLGKQVHALMVKTVIGVRTQSWNSLMDFYIKSGEDLRSASRIFYGIHNPDVVSWNSLLDGYVKSGDLERAQKLFGEMPKRDLVSWTTMLVGYSNAGMTNEARQLFDEMPNRTMISCTAMIDGYLKSNMYAEGLALFGEMQELEVRIDRITLTTLLSACAKLGSLDQGRWIHAYINKHDIQADAKLCTALVDMYGKCGRIDLAYKVFRESRDKQVFLWNAMLGGFAMHSQGKRTIELFVEMTSSGTKPNEITFICVLSACSHSGRVEDGLRIFHSMEGGHKIVPTIEHYGCLVDLLGRSGLLEDARTVIETMPMTAGPNIWRSLLGACVVHGDVELGKQVGRILLDLEPLDDGNYVLLSNVYATNKRWENVGRLRRMMKERGVSKTPGCSLIEVNGVLNEFVAGDWSHANASEIYALTNELGKHISSTEYNQPTE